jgi:hypothetical protein
MVVDSLTMDMAVPICGVLAVTALDLLVTGVKLLVGRYQFGGR